MNRKTLVLTLTSLCGGFGLGLLISFLLFTPNQANEDTSSSQDTEFNSSVNFEDAEELASRPPDLVDIIEIASASDRRRAIYQLLENQSDLQILELLNQSFSVDRSINLYSVQEILFAELARTDPVKSLELLWQTERSRWGSLLDEVATHWSLIAPEDALTAFSSLTEPWKRRAIQTVLKNQGSVTELELAEISESLEITDLFLLWTHEVELAEVLDEPRQAFKLTLNAEISDLDKQRLVLQITNRWLERVGSNDIRDKLDLVFDVFTNEGSILFRPVVAEIAKSNPVFAWERLSEMSLEHQRSFSGSVFDVLVKSDPDAALEVITKKEYMTHLEFSHNSFLATWVRAVSDRFLDHVEKIPETDKIRAIRIAVNHLAYSSPPHEVIELLAQLRARGLNTLEATDSFVEIWSRKEPDAAVEWVLENLEQGRNSGSFMLGSALEQLALLDPEEAMKIALEQPSESQLERSVVMELLRQGEIDTALALSPQVRKSPWYGSIYHSVSFFMIGEGRIEDALALAERLEELERPFFYRDLVFPWLYNDADSLLESLPKMANSEIQAIMAASVLHNQKTGHYLTEKELEFVRTFIPDNHD